MRNNLRTDEGHIVGVVLKAGHPDLFDCTVRHFLQWGVTGMVDFPVGVIAGGVVTADE